MGAGKDVMELDEQKILERGMNLLMRIGDQVLSSGKGGHFLEAVDFVLEETVFLLDSDDACVTPDCPGIQVSGVAGQGFFLPREFFEIGLRRGMQDRYIAGLSHQAGNILKIFPGGTSAVVPHAPEDKAEGEIRMLFDPGFDFFMSLSQAGAIISCGAMSENLRTIVTDPDKILPGSVIQEGSGRQKR